MSIIQSILEAFQKIEDNKLGEVTIDTYYSTPWGNFDIQMRAEIIRQRFYVNESYRRRGIYSSENIQVNGIALPVGGISDSVERSVAYFKRALTGYLDEARDGKIYPHWGDIERLAKESGGLLIITPLI